ncbi:MAG: acyltransferase [Deltaproteobacteria bacterium]|nr:acyltransferase [Deltaproteobacteria bacterium]
MIARGAEMEVEPRSVLFGPGRPFPPRPQILRQLLNLYRADLPYCRRILRSLVLSQMAGVGSGAFEPGFRCFYGNVHADGASLADTKIVDYAPVYIGKGTGFSFDNLLITSTHGLPDFENVTAAEIIIGENVWITSRVTILGGVRIGRNSVIAAGSVVTCDIPPNVTAGGIPARVISDKHR